MKINLKKINNYNKKVFLIVSDLLIIIVSIIISFSLRLEEIFFITDIDLRVYLVFCTVFFSVFFINNIYQILLRYFDFFSIKKITISLLICMLILIPLNFYFYKFFYFPRSISFIAPLIIYIIILLHRIFINFIINLSNKNAVRVNNIMVIGLSADTIEIINNIRLNSTYGKIKGLIDVSDKFKRREFNGIKIYKKEDIFHLISRKKINEIIIGSKSLDKDDIDKLFIYAENKNIRIKNLINNKNYFKNLINYTLTPKVSLFEVINRSKIEVNKKILLNKIKNKNILITGGGGTIGSELCLEISKHNPNKIYILDNSELSLFNTLEILKKQKWFNHKTIKLILGDCNDSNFLNNIFSKIKIDQLYHAAAYKHVGFGEENPYSMIKNNILGSKTVIEFAINKKINEFVFISSDKAVNPRSILGYSKQFGEKLVKYLYLKNRLNLKTKFTIVRFGNVIASSGSVIPKFLNQIENGGPVTVTSKKARRYFMSIGEAVQLVIMSSYLNKEGVKIYALNMGDQINIYNIAKRIIKLSGKTIKNKNNPYGDIKIKIIGLKKGEKESEELTLGKKLIPTEHSMIMECDEEINIENMQNKIDIIEKSLSNNYNFKIMLDNVKN